jgi:PAS domain S-box-containing protein
MDEKIKNYKLILNAIRRVNRLIVREHDRDKLLHGICDSLIETSIFSSAWIALFNDSGNLKAFAGAGLGELDLELKKMLERGQLPVCVQKALEQSKPMVIKEPTECDDCPLAKKYVDLGRMVVRIKVREKIYGILAATSPKYIFMEKENQDLFKEVAEDIGIGLRCMELEKKRILAEYKIKAYAENLERSVEKRTKELKRALYDTEEARDKIDSILKSVAEGLIVTDIYDRIILMNSAAEDLLNTRFSEVYGRHIDNAIQDIKLREQFKSALEKKKTGYCFDFELPGENKKHPRIIRARTSMMPNKTGRHTGIIIIIYDVTYEREIDRMKSEFISIAAHELKTPLTSILGFSEILMKHKDLSEEKKIKYLNYINEQSNKLANIIDDLLNISRIESGLGFSINKAPCNINKIILEAIDYFQELCPARRFDITLPEKSVEITADKDKIDQALKNIISNAIKYSPENSHVCLSARVIQEIKAKRKQSEIEISVADKGIGMTSEQSKKIFDKFYRVDSSDKAIPGSGLGMHIVKNIVEAHDGRIWVESKFEKGTTVTFTLPV